MLLKNLFKVGFAFTLDKENKKVLLNNYINNSTISNDLKDKVINELTNSYILENNLDNNDKEVESINLVVDNFKDKKERIRRFY